LRNEVEKLQQQVATLTCETSQKCIKEAIARKEEELAKLKVSKTQSAAKERENLAAASAALERKATEKQEAGHKHEAARQEAERKFQAEFEAAQTKLNQVAALFKDEMRAAREEWAAVNGALIAELQKAKELGEERAVAAAPAAAAATLYSQQQKRLQRTQAEAASAIAVPEDQPGTTAAATTAAQQGDAEAQRLIDQLGHRVELDSSELADLSAAQPNPQELTILARLWSWAEAMSLEDPATLVYFRDVGVDVPVLVDLVGKKIWDRMFPVRVPLEEDVLPFQLRSIVASQMRHLASTLSGTDYEGARREGAEACKKQRTTMKVVKVGQTFSPY
jgi:hypothetical protein